MCDGLCSIDFGRDIIDVTFSERLNRNTLLYGQLNIFLLKRCSSADLEQIP